LLLRGGYIRPLSQGLYSFLPLATRVLNRIKAIIAEEMDALGGQEVLLPVVNPLDIWRKSGRDSIADLVEFKDHTGKRLVLAPTHEEAMIELVRSVVDSYRQFPIFLYQFQTKYRNERRVRGGLLRTREFVMKDAYSFHRSFTGLNNFFPKVFQAYERIFARCQVPVVAAEAAVGFMLGDRSYEFLMPCTCGDDVVILCPDCGYTANADVAVGTVETFPEPPEPLEQISTPECTTMDRLATYLTLPRARLAKTMVYSGVGEIVLAVVRGDQEVSVDKLARVLGGGTLRLAARDELEYLGMTPGYISPVDLPLEVMELDTRVRVVVDTVAAQSPNLVIASNEEGYHYRNANFGRDFESLLVEDIARVLPGAHCVHCGTELENQRVVEVGNIFRLGEHYSRRMGLVFPDSRGGRFYPSIGSYGIGLGRLLTATVEANHDKRGIMWPPEMAPFDCFLMTVGKSATLSRVAAQIHNELSDRVLFDDRKESISTKFKDADLIGIPYRIIISPSTHERGEAEVLERTTGRARRVKITGIKRYVEQLRGGAHE
jgi:prolyl-tRNA synthetase